jgi:hypothetical protein
MGGTNETTVAGLRIHHNNGEIHIHDDQKSQKFSMDERSFSHEITKALKLLKQKDTVVIIEGIGTDLCLGKNDKDYFMALAGNTTVAEITKL